MEDHSITGLVESYTSQFKLSMTFNISQCAAVDTRMHQHNLLFLLSNMLWNISCTIHMNPSCTHFFYKNHESLQTYYFKAGDVEINKNKESSNFLHTYCDADHAKYLADRRSVTSTVHLFNGNFIDWCAMKQYGTSRRSSNTETKAIYTGL